MQTNMKVYDHDGEDEEVMKKMMKNSKRIE